MRRLSGTAVTAEVALSDTTVSSSLIGSKTLGSDSLASDRLLSGLLADTLSANGLLGLVLTGEVVTLTRNGRVIGRTGAGDTSVVVMLASQTPGSGSSGASLGLGGK